MSSEESFGIIPLKREGDEWFFFLILHKHGNHWGFPKGKGEKGETALQSATRELLEETGLKVERILSDKPISESYIFSRRGKKVEKTVTYFPALVSGVFLLQPEEIRDGNWFSYSEAYKRFTFDEARSICKNVHSVLPDLHN